MADSLEIRAEDGTRIHVWHWSIPQPKAVLVIAHGMGEHGRRYGELARHLNGQGICVHAPDHRGHGETSRLGGRLGLFDREEGWDKVIGDLLTLCRSVGAEYPDRPLFLMGHSMGSFLSRDFASRHGGRLKGLILSGTAQGGAELGLAGALTRWQCRFQNPESISRFWGKLTLGAMNNTFSPARTDFDWLSSDPDHVDAYVADPLCGFDFCLGFYRDFFRGLGWVCSPGCFLDTPGDLPIFCFAGDRDPVGKFGKSVTKVVNLYGEAGNTDVTLRLYPGGRHEMVGEPCKEEVFLHISQWILERI